MTETMGHDEATSQPTAVVVGVGAERGLGAALCRRFAAAGCYTLVAGRTWEKLERVVQTIRGAGGRAEPVALDTTRENDVARLFDMAISPGSGREPADLVVFNAGNNQRIDFRALTAQQFEDFWRVGCFGGFLVGREAARRLAPLGRGTIIFTGASASRRGKPGFAHFSAAKAGLRMISQSMAREYGSLGLHVAHIVIDGGIDSDRLRTSSMNAARTDCSVSMRSPKPTGRSIVSRARPGRRKSTCGRSRKHSDANRPSRRSTWASWMER